MTFVARVASEVEICVSSVPQKTENLLVEVAMAVLIVGLYFLASCLSLEIQEEAFDLSSLCLEATLEQTY